MTQAPAPATITRRYVIPTVALRIAGQDVTLRDVELLAERGEHDSSIVANLGQDVLRSFDTVVIDFASMALELVRDGQPAS